MRIAKCALLCFTLALAKEKKPYQPTERMVKCVDVDMNDGNTSAEDKEACKLALADSQNNMEVHRLLEKGHDPNTVLDRDGRTLLITATFSGKKDVIAELLNFGATKGINVNQRTESGHTALMYAAARGEADLVRLFTLAGAGVNLQLEDGKKSGYSPLHFAAERGNVKIAKILVDAGANVQVKDAAGRTPLDLAAGQHPTTIKELKELFNDDMSDIDVELD